MQVCAAILFLGTRKNLYSREDKYEHWNANGNSIHVWRNPTEESITEPSCYTLGRDKHATHVNLIIKYRDDVSPGCMWTTWIQNQRTMSQYKMWYDDLLLADRSPHCGVARSGKGGGAQCSERVRPLISESIRVNAIFQPLTCFKYYRQCQRRNLAN